MAKLWALMAAILRLSGILVESSPPQIRVVTAVEVRIHSTESEASCRVTDPEMMHRILQYLRQLDPYTSVEIEADTFRADRYDLMVEYSDGGSTHYSQLYNEYLKTEDGPWKSIDPEDGAGLLGILTCIWEDTDI